MRPSHLTALFAARRAAAEKAAAEAAAELAAVAAAAALAAEKHRQDRAAAAEQYRQQTAAVAAQRAAGSVDRTEQQLQSSSCRAAQTRQTGQLQNSADETDRQLQNSADKTKRETEKESMSRTLFTRSCCCDDACEETVMHVKSTSHDQVFNALQLLPYSLFFSVELHFILQSLYDNSLKLRLSTDLYDCSTHTHTHH